MTVKSAADGVRVHLRVSGQVQGVFYRASTQEEAERLGLVGWVRNAPDGSVEVEAEGPPQRVQELIAWCRQGPPAARVRDVEVTECAPTGEDRAFRIA